MTTQPQDPAPDAKFEFIGGLTESTLVRSKHALSDFAGRDIADAIFIYFLSLEILRHQEPKATIAGVYANNTLRFGGFDKFRTSANDLYVLLHVLLGDQSEDARTFLKQKEASIKFLDQIVIHPTVIKNYLRDVQNQYDKSARVFFLSLETRLKINDPILKAIRRRVVDWQSLDQTEKEITVRRLSRAYRSKLMKSELRRMIDQLVHEIDDKS